MPTAALSVDPARLLWLALLLMLCAPDGHAANTPKNDPGCRLIGQTLFRLAEQRDESVPPEMAVIRVNRWLQGIHRTGSHYKPSYLKLLPDLATFVYANDTLNRTTLYQYGVHSCGLGHALAHEPETSSQAAALLGVSAQACQDRFPQKSVHPQRMNCLKQAAESIRHQLQQPELAQQQRR
jgi:hypothetical protein